MKSTPPDHLIHKDSRSLVLSAMRMSARNHRTAQRPALTKAPLAPATQHLDKLSYLQHYEEREPVTERKKEPVVYYRIANHYK